MKSNLLPGMQEHVPPKPTARDEHVATRIAERIVEEVNLDECYWETHELPMRVAEMKQMIMSGTPCTGRLIRALSREYGGRIWGWEGIEDHCCVCGPEFAKEEVEKAIDNWKRKFNQ